MTRFPQPAWSLLLLGFAAMPVASVVAQGQPAVVAPDPLVAVADADPLELARVVQRLGDDAVVARLKATQRTEVRLAAIRATRYLRVPESALLLLPAIIGERDDLLGQAAARAVYAIVSALTIDDLQRHEILPAELAPACAALERVVATEHVRADLRALAKASAATLSSLTSAR